VKSLWLDVGGGLNSRLPVRLCLVYPIRSPHSCLEYGTRVIRLEERIGSV